MSELMQLFSQAFSVASTIFMIWMLIHCIRNQAIKNKAAWIIFILVTQFIGSIVYFFTRGPWPQVKSFLLSQRSHSSAPTTFVPQPMPEETFSAYERGYQAQPQARMPTAQNKKIYTEHASPLQPEYEQSLVTYPEMPPIEESQ